MSLIWGAYHLEIKAVSKIYKKKNTQVNALKEANLVLHEGEILGIVGESGSGKSTLLRLISGLEPVSSGGILLAGKPYPDFEKLSSEVGLSVDLMKKYPRQLSGGQCQRFAIARAVMTSPKILCYNEKMYTNVVWIRALMYISFS